MFFFRRPQKKFKFQPLEIEEIFLDYLFKKKEEESGLLKRKIESSLEEKRFLIFLVIEILFLLILLLVSFKFQIIEHLQYSFLAQKNQFLDLKIKAQRGVIYDRNMNQLVFNRNVFNLVAKISKLPKEEKEREKSIEEIAKIINFSPQELKEKINQVTNDLVLFKKDLSLQELILIEAQNKKFLGFEIKKQPQREYLKEDSLSHILGYLGEISTKELEKDLKENYEIGDYVGKEGLEKQYEKILVEKKGLLKIKRDVLGKEISQEIKKIPQSGKSLVLSLDLELQKKISEILKKILKEKKSEAAMAVALNPQTGEILASVSLPSFDNNLFSKGIALAEFKELNEDPKNPQLNRIIKGNYLVGSTIKPLIGLAALEEGIITEKTIFFCPLYLCFSLIEKKGQKTCFADWKFHGWADIKKGIAESVNPFFYFIGGGYKAPVGADPKLPKYFKGLGVIKIANWLKKFGWAEKTGVDLPGELAGRVPTPAWKENYFASYPKSEQIWYQGDTYNLSIGQGYILATPLQVAVSFQLIANKGKIFKPHLVKAILTHSEGDNLKKEEISPQVLKENIVSPKTIEIIREGMRLAVSSPQGSAVTLNSLSVAVAAKTGTAQIYPQKQIYHYWITVFAPYENPEILLTIVLEKTKGLQPITQQIAKEILEWYFENSKINKIN